MKITQKLFAIFTLVALLTLTFATPALAFDGRSGNVVVVEADEVVNDDLYVSADRFTLDGIVKGDLFVAGSTITINGTVEGDLIAAGQTVVINGTVMDDARIAGAALQLGDESSIGGDLISAGASLEARESSAVEGDLLFGGGQALLAGSVGDDSFIGTSALRLSGQFGGDVTAEVADASEAGPSPAMYIQDIEISLPAVAPGLTVTDNAKIEGDLTYTQSLDLDIPSGTVGGEITRNEPVVDESYAQPVPPTASELAATWVFDLLRNIVTLFLFGLLLVWLVPGFMKALTEKIQTQPTPSFGWGLVSYATFAFVFLLLFILIIMGGIIFGGRFAWATFLVFSVLLTSFGFFTAFMTKILMAWMGGKWILGRISPNLAESKIWPLALGVVIIGLLVKLPLVGWLVSILIMFFGLGALWLWGRERWSARKEAVPVAVTTE